MTIDINSYLNDGANCQAQAVLAMLRARVFEPLDKVYVPEKNTYLAEVEVYRYDEGRENGYVFTLRPKVYPKIWQHNFAVFEACCSDNIFVVENEEFYMDNPTWDEVRKECPSKFDATKKFGYGHIMECVSYIINRMGEVIEEKFGTDIG